MFSIKIFPSFTSVTQFLVFTYGELDQLVDRPFSIREVRGSKPRFSILEKEEKKRKKRLKALGPAATRLSCSSRGEEQCAVTSFAAHTARTIPRIRPPAAAGGARYW